jgi:hypothetical protein
MLPIESNSIPGDIQLAMHDSDLLGELLTTMRGQSRREGLPVLAINRLSDNTLRRFGIDHTSNGLYIGRGMGMAEGLYVNVAIQIQSLEHIWNKKGEEEIIETFPIIREVFKDEETKTNIALVVQMPRYIIFSGSRLSPQNEHPYHEPFIQPHVGQFIKDKPAALIACEAYCQLANAQIKTLLSWSLDVTDPEVRYEIAQTRGETLELFEQKLAGKKLLIYRQGSGPYTSYTADGKNFT